jgi:hypothetical protein
MACEADIIVPYKCNSTQVIVILYRDTRHSCCKGTTENSYLLRKACSCNKASYVAKFHFSWSYNSNNTTNKKFIINTLPVFVVLDGEALLWSCDVPSNFACGLKWISFLHVCPQVSVHRSVTEHTCSDSVPTAQHKQFPFFFFFLMK